MDATSFDRLTAHIMDMGIKSAATRQVKEIRRLVAAGDLDKANALAARLREGGVLKQTPLGTHIRTLGTGREGVADLVLGASDAPNGHEIAVRKSYDPQTSLYNPQYPDRKVQIGAGLGDDQNFAQMFTKDKARLAGDVPYHISEYVPGTGVTRAHNNTVAAAVDRGNAAAQRVIPGGKIDDVIGHADNVRVTPSGVPKIIDYMPRAATEQDRTGFLAAHPNYGQTAMDIEARADVHRMLGNQAGANKILTQLHASQQNIHAGYAAAAKAPPVPTSPMNALLTRFRGLSGWGKAGVVGGAAATAATAIGGLGYGAHRMLRGAAPPAAQPAAPAQTPAAQAPAPMPAAQPKPAVPPMPAAPPRPAAPQQVQPMVPRPAAPQQVQPRA